MPDPDSRRRAGRAKRRLVVSVAAPDGSDAATRGLAQWLSASAPARARGAVSIALVSDGRMRSLNRVYRGKDKVTDVLSFPTERLPSTPADQPIELGDIVIAHGVAARQAKEAGHPLSREIRVLALHGLLHLLGYDHEADDGLMARVEERLRRKAGLSEGLIARGRRGAAS